MLFQPYIENAILHGLRHKEGNGILKLQISLQNGHLKCILEDNGIGREKSMEINSKKRSRHQSYGTEITEKRIELQENLNQYQTSVQYIDLKDKDGNALGTRVIIDLIKPE